MACAPPLRERVLVGDLTEPENDCASVSLNPLRPARYKEWSEERMKLAMQAMLEKRVSIGQQLRYIDYQRAPSVIEFQVESSLG